MANIVDNQVNIITYEDANLCAYLDLRRRDFGEHTEHESSVQLTELFDGERVPFKELREIFFSNTR